MSQLGKIYQQIKQRNPEIDERLARQQAWVLRDKQIFEKNTVVSAAASSAAGAAGGGRKAKVQNTFLAFDFDSANLFLISETGNLTNVAQIFNGLTVLSDCSDDTDFVYFVTYDSILDKVIFGKFDKVNYQRIDIDDTNLNNEINSVPNSLYYAGGGNFIYSTEFFRQNPNTQNILSISIDGQTINVLSTFDGSSTSLINIFNFNNQDYAVLLDNLTISGLSYIDLNTGSTELVDYFSMNVQTLPASISSNTKVWYVFDVRLKGDVIWASVIFVDKEFGGYPYGCIGKINLAETSIDYVTPLPFLIENYVFTSFVVL